MTVLANAIRNGNKCCLLASRGRHELSLSGELEIESGICAADEENDTEITSADVERGY